MTILPLPGKCLVEILPENNMTDGGLVIPDSVKGKDGMGKLPPLKAKVWRLGRWPQKKNGLAVLPEFSPGDTVLVNQYSGVKLKRLGDKFRLVALKDVLAIVQ